ncbi:polysaccharide synthesis protein GtrA [Sporanaerobium hydrogeniformans]|uniref:Polysaccharide synthesis protein GtrA n=1 Tax=Sporanaerobium hydrogeniformans TaxID=3072179 RepID=A0AC61DBG5_9FIRM|nr:GtrA family protein [Sporanaerobium hydrogeniformans]PHV70609.1 polysaccharide synthesis protein GtrA [Sporanaerobium hydrogeniformans]
MNNLKKVVNIFYNKQFMLFILIGGINSIVTIIVSYIYSLLFEEVFSFILGYTTGTFISYILNSYITFKDELGIKKYVKFLISCIPNFITQLIIVWLVVEIFSWHKMIGYILAAAIGMPITFILLKLYVFIKKNE